MVALDVGRAKQIMNSAEEIQVLYQDVPVWIQNVRDNNTAEVIRLEGGNKTAFEVPVYMLVENSPAKH